MFVPYVPPLPFLPLITPLSTVRHGYIQSAQRLCRVVERQLRSERSQGPHPYSQNRRTSWLRDMCNLICAC